MWIILSMIVIIVIILFLISTTKKSESNYYSKNDNYNIQQQENFGKLGEKCVADMLKNFDQTYKTYLFNDFTFMDDDGYSTNIDHILICQGGVFIIETKSNKGRIYGREEGEFWKAQKKEWQEDKGFKNPIKQNNGHINHLKKILGNKAPKMYSMIIFPFAESISVQSNIVYDLNSAQKFIKSKIQEANYSGQFIEKIYKEFLLIKNKYEIPLNQHKDNINKMH